MSKHVDGCTGGTFCPCPRDAQCPAVLIEMNFYTFTTRCTLTPGHPGERHKGGDKTWSDPYAGVTYGEMKA